MASSRPILALPVSELAGARRRVESLWSDVGRVEVSPAIAAHAAGLAETHGLRAYDAVHVASCLEVAEEDTIMAVADDRLKGVAQALAITVARLA